MDTKEMRANNYDDITLYATNFISEFGMDKVISIAYHQSELYWSVYIVYKT